PAARRSPCPATHASLSYQSRRQRAADFPPPNSSRNSCLRSPPCFPRSSGRHAVIAEHAKNRHPRRKRGGGNKLTATDVREVTAVAGLRGCRASVFSNRSDKASSLRRRSPRR